MAGISVPRPDTGRLRRFRISATKTIASQEPGHNHYVMKKLFLFVFAVAACLTAYGQGRVLGVRAGLNVTNIDLTSGGHTYSFDSRASYHVGFAYQQPLLRALPLYLETGLYLTGRGGSVDVADFGFDFDEELSGKVKFNMLYLQVPVLISWHFNIKSVSIQPLAGVFYGFGVHGKAKYRGEKVNVFKSTDLGDGAEEEGAFKRSDLGLRFGANVTFRKHYNVSLGYDLGLLNILKDADDVKGKNGSFYLSLGYNF